MKKVFWIIGFVVVLASSCQVQTEINREQDFNRDWKFSLDQKEDAYGIDLTDTDWRSLNLPHDWSVEFPFDSINGEGCTGYLPGGIGWYRKHFSSPTEENKLLYILFDGVYNNSEYWINGQKLGEHPYGYSPFYFDLTPYLNESGENILAVKVDRSRYADSRWYTGSGIYRNVKLIEVPKLHIPVWGNFITTPKVSKEEAVVNLNITISNKNKAEQTFDLETSIIDPSGKTVLEINTENTTLKSGEKIITQNGVIKNPALWGIETPNLYKAITKVVVNNKTIDKYSSTFGIRSFRFDADLGFFLNGENMKIKGVCLHHDGGLVGSAVPKAVWKRRLKILREGGCNAVRISHNPGSEEFLELCDEMGFLVQDEFFDEWDYPKDKRLNMNEQHDDYITRGYTEHFQDWNEFDLKNVMLAHRNHPSIIQWSIGNEIEWTYPRNSKATGFFDNMDWSGDYFWSQPPYSPEKIKETYENLPAKEYNIGKTAKQLAAWTRELDTTRPVVANCILPSASFETGYADALDIVGFSYRRVMYDYAKKNYPNKIVMGTENLPQWHEWKAIEERPFISGTFLWTGIDYMGESNAQWPRKGTTSGMIDQAGFPKPSYHMYKTLWQNEPYIYICSNTAKESQYIADKNGIIKERNPGAWEKTLWFWHHVNEHWNYEIDDPIIVEVISNCEKVELFLNDVSLGTKKLSDFPDRIYKWTVPFSEGKLVAKGSMNGVETEASIATTGEAVAIKIDVDNTNLIADGYDAAHVIVQLVDANGNPVKIKEQKLSFKVEGPVTSLGVDNGWGSNTQTYSNNEIITHLGRAMTIVKSTTEKGSALITVEADGLESAYATITIK